MDIKESINNALPDNTSKVLAGISLISALGAGGFFLKNNHTNEQIDLNKELAQNRIELAVTKATQQTIDDKTWSLSQTQYIESGPDLEKMVDDNSLKHLEIWTNDFIAKLNTVTHNANSGIINPQEATELKNTLESDGAHELKKYVEQNGIRNTPYNLDKLIENLRELEQALYAMPNKEHSESNTALALLITSLLTALGGAITANTKEKQYRRTEQKKDREIGKQQLDFNHYLSMKQKEYQQQLNEQDFNNKNQKNYLDYLQSMFAKKGVEKNQTEAEKILSIKLNKRILEILEMKKIISDDNVEFRKNQKELEEKINDNATEANSIMLEIKELVDSTYKNNKEELKNSYLVMLINRYNQELQEAIDDTKKNVKPNDKEFRKMSLKNAEATLRNFGKLRSLWGIGPKYGNGYFNRK